MTDTFYELDVCQQQQGLEDLARAALANWNIDHSSHLSLIKYRENAVFRVDDYANDARYVIRVHRADYHSNQELNSELLWMDALTDAGILTPRVIPTKAGLLFETVTSPLVPEPRQCDVLEWIDGLPLGSIEGTAQEDVKSLISNFEIVGALQARLHNQSSDWALPSDFARHSWDIPGMFGPEPIWGHFWELAILSKDELKIVLAAKEKLVEHLTVFGQENDRYSLIHADCLPENIIVGPDSMRLIDFDDAGFGWHLFDIATSLFYHLGEEYYDDLERSIVSGYRSERALAEAHLEMLPAFLLARGITYLSWLHTRKEAELAKTMGRAIVESVVSQAKAYLGQ